MDNWNNMVNILKDIDNRDIFCDLSDINKEIDEIGYNNLKEGVSIDLFLKWKERNCLHSFPKYEKNWLNAIKNQKNLRVSCERYDLNRIIRNIKDRQHIPFYHKEMYDRVLYNIRLNKDTNSVNMSGLTDACYIIVDIPYEEVYNILIKNNILYKIGRRVRASPVIFKKRICSDILVPGCTKRRKLNIYT
jgi:hypothetical protein